MPPFEELNKKYMDIFISKGGIEYMIKSFDSLITYDNETTRNLFKEELISSLKKNGPFSVSILMKSFKEIVGGSGYHIPLTTQERFGKVTTSFVLPPLENYIEKCVSVGTMKLDEIEFDLLSTKMVDKENAKEISNRINSKFK